MKSFVISIAAVSAAFTVMTGAASANTISIADGLGSIDCTTSCEAFAFGAPSLGAEPNAAGALIDGTPTSEEAWYYDGTPSNEGAEADRLSTLISGSTGLFSSSDGNAITGNGGSMSFSTFAEYVVMKIGNLDIFVKNTSGGELMIDYTSTPGAGTGLSHYTEFGKVSEVPLPAAIWLMGAGLAGLGFSSRKKKKV